MSRNVKLHIRELVVHGGAGLDRRALGDAVQREMTRLLAQPGGIAPQSRSTVDAGCIRPTQSASRLGQQVARATCRALRGRS